MILNEHQIYDYNLITRCHYYLTVFFSFLKTTLRKRNDHFLTFQAL